MSLITRYGYCDDSIQKPPETSLHYICHTKVRATQVESGCLCLVIFSLAIKLQTGDITVLGVIFIYAKQNRYCLLMGIILLFHATNSMIYFKVQQWELQKLGAYESTVI